jgi:hypothetical protein
VQAGGPNARHRTTFMLVLVLPGATWPHLLVVRLALQQLWCHVRGCACAGLTHAVARQPKVTHLSTEQAPATQPGPNSVSSRPQGYVHAALPGCVGVHGCFALRTLTFHDLSSRKLAGLMSLWICAGTESVCVLQYACQQPCSCSHRPNQTIFCRGCTPALHSAVP